MFVSAPTCGPWFVDSQLLHAVIGTSKDTHYQYHLHNITPVNLSEDFLKANVSVST